MILKIKDDGVPFDPFEQDAPDIELALEDREIGGLGIHLARKVMDEASYQRQDDKNVVTFIKHLEIHRNA
jgi:sigma-B regulation protein RsbU (phosphoserine phosphatase)